MLLEVGWAQMKRLLLAACLAACVASSAARARDSDDVLRGSLVDALVEFREDEQGEKVPAAIESDRGPSTTNPARPRRDSTLDDISSGSGNEPEPSGSSSDDETGTPHGDVIVRGGYDSNYDETVDGTKSGYIELSGSRGSTRVVGDTTYYNWADATLLEFFNFPFFRERGSATVRSAVRKKLSSEFALQGAVEAEIDATEDPVTAFGATSIGFEWLRPDVLIAGRASMDGEFAVHSPEGFEDYRSYDYYLPALEASMLFRPAEKVSPYITGAISRPVFPRQFPLDDVEDGDFVAGKRDAVQSTGALGFRLSMIKDVVVKVAGRVTNRDFDGDQNSRTVFSPDVEASWYINDDTTLEVSFQRTLSESEVFGSLVDDTSAFSALWDYAPDQGLGLKLLAEFERSREVGIGSLTDDLTLEAVTTYRVDAHRAVEVGVLHTWSDDRTGPSDTERTKVSVGGRYSY